MVLPILIMQLAANLTFATSPSHSAARPFSNAAPYINGLDQIRYVELDEMQSKNLSGWNNEKPSVRASYLAQANEYIQYRRMGRAGAKSAFAEKCAKDASQNVFCEMETARIGQRLALQEARAKPFPKAKIVEQIRKGEIGRLRELDRQQLIRSLGQFDDFAQLQSLAEKVAADTKCQAPHLALALGTKAEEYFPDPKYIDLARQLYTRAYSCTQDTSVTVHARFRAALLSIWKNDCSSVDEMLTPILSVEEADGFWARARYWRYYCAQQTKNSELSKQVADDLWQNHPMSLQNVLVNGEDPRFITLMQDKEKPRVLYRSILNPDLNKYAQAIEALMQLKEHDLVSDVVNVLSPKLANGESGFRLYLAALTSRFESALPRFKVLALLFRDQPSMLKARTLRMYFPVAHLDMVEDSQSSIDPFLVLSLIRQESAFNSRAMSSAGARGLMQMMPATAKQLGARTKNSLFDPRVNIRVGTKYFAKQLKSYEGDVELTLAAYNAGFSRVDGWLKRYPVENRLLFLDLIPFRETRDYVTSIVRNYYWYVQLYSKEPLKARLAKSAKAPRVPIKMLSLGDSSTMSVQAQ